MKAKKCKNKIYKQLEKLTTAVENMKPPTEDIGIDDISDIEMTEADWEVVAYHECGHAIISRVLCKNIIIESINLGRNSIGEKGYNVFTYKNQMRKKSDFLNEVASTFGGMLAEEAIYGEHSSGCCGDLYEAKRMVTSMLKDYGMGKRLSYCEDYLEVLEEETEEILQEQKLIAEAVIKKNIDLLKEMQKILFKQRKIKRKKLYKLFKKYGI